MRVFAVAIGTVACAATAQAVGGDSSGDSGGGGGVRHLGVTAAVLQQCENPDAACDADVRFANLADCFFDAYQGTFRGWPPFHAPPARIDKIAIVGERASGTFFAQKMLSQNFLQPVQHQLTRHKHWFQREVPAAELDRTLVVVVFRNAWDWVESLYRHPWHAPEHFGIPFEDFLQTPWTIPPSKLPPGASSSSPSSSSSATPEAAAAGRRCQNDFAPGEVVPCQPADLGGYSYARGDFMNQRNPNEYPAQYGGKEPIYEMDPFAPTPGTPFASPLALRAAKIRSFLDISKWAPHVAFLRYEDLLDPNTAELVVAGLQQRYSALTPRNEQPHVEVEHYKGFSRHRPTQGFRFDAKTLFYLYPDDPVASPKTARLREPAAYCLINATLDHAAEASIGYAEQPSLQLSLDCGAVTLPPLSGAEAPTIGAGSQRHHHNHHQQQQPPPRKKKKKARPRTNEL